MGAIGGVAKSHEWRFFRCGGFDQVRIETADDLRHLGELDQKLWSVLACPTTGLEFDSRTLQLIDSDDDGHIRAPEIIAAVNWVCAVLKQPEVLFAAGGALPLEAIDAGHPEGARLLATAKKILAYLDQPDAESISVAELADTTRLFASDHFNGDGIIPVALAGGDVRLERAITHIIECIGGETDRSGQTGVGADAVEAFFAQAQALSEWQARAEDGAEVMLPLGDNTAAAAAIFEALRSKIDDYFTRCRLAEFDRSAADALNPGEAAYVALAPASLYASADGIRALPLGLAAPNRPLPLVEGVNPGWADQLAALRSEVIEPVLGARDELSYAEWEDLAARFGAYRAWSAAKPTLPVATIPMDELRTMLADGTREALADLIARDLAAETAAAQVEAVERLVRYRRDLVTLLRNYVSLSDFFGARSKAIFQAGTLYLDQRSCELCLRVTDMDRHAALAPLSGTYLVYCQCVRQGEAPLIIVAAMTGGDADEMMVPGRNGVFYDRRGRDWNASIVKVVVNPISVRQAMWLPYKRIGRMVGDQIQKFAASRDKAMEDKAAAGIADAGAKVEAPAPAVPQAFDIAKFAGIFAAIGLAVGAIGTALAAVVTGLLSLPAWQMPLVLVGIVVLISGPSMLLAWLKLRQRNLGPLLDANGWAVNTRARINIPFGAALTKVAALPPGSARSLEDPFAERRTPWKRYVVIVGLIVVTFILWRQGHLDPLLGAQPPEAAVTTESAPATAPPAAEPPPAN